MRRAAPGSHEEIAEALAAASSAGRSVRPRGGGTKWGWGHPIPPCDLEISTAGLDRIVEHNPGDLTATVQAGVALGDLQRALGERNQMLALDPPLTHPGGGPEIATVGGVVASADSGPLRHRYGAVRDLVLGVTVALSDGTLARAGGKVIKNVAGYDLAKLFAGSFGTLGLVLQVTVRLHPRPAGSITVLGRSDDPAALQRAASALAHASLALDAADLAWSGGSGMLAARVSGAGRLERVAEARRLMEGAGLEVELEEDDEAVWAAQRAAQRCAEGAIVRVGGLVSETARTLDAARRLGASLVGRAGLGLWWLRFPPGPIDELVGAIEELRAALAPAPCVVTDAPAALRERVDVWGGEKDGALALMRRVKERFDPTATLSPGIFVGGM